MLYCDHQNFLPGFSLGSCWHTQEQALGGLDAGTGKLVDGFARGERPAAERRLKHGTVLVREYQGERHTVTVIPGGYVWRETTYASLSTIARAITGTAWNGPRFFGLRTSPNRSQEIEPERAGPHTGPTDTDRRRGRNLANVPRKRQRSEKARRR